jgi:hypothetical protein
MPKYNQNIPRPELPAVDTLPLRFSFKYLHFDNPKFYPSECSVEYLRKLFEALHHFSKWTVGHFIWPNNEEHRHIINFEQTCEKDGFQHIPQIDQEQFGYQEGWQFSIWPERYYCDWRVHGVLGDDTFFVVWLDEHHRLFPRNE